MTEKKQESSGGGGYEKYSYVGTVITGGPHNPQVAPPKRKRLTESPLGPGAANISSLWDIGEGAVGLGLGLIFTPRDVYRQAKRGYEKDEERAQHHLKYESVLSPIYTAYSRKFREEDMANRERELLAKGEEIKLSEYPTRQEEERELRRKMRAEQGERKLILSPETAKKGFRWFPKQEIEDERIRKNREIAIQKHKEPIIIIPPANRWDKNIPLALRQNIKLYPYEGSEEEKKEREGIITEEELKKYVKEKQTIEPSYGKGPLSRMIGREKSLQYNPKKYKMKEQALEALEKQNERKAENFRQKMDYSLNRYATGSKYPNLLVVETSNKIIKERPEQKITTYYETKRKLPSTKYEPKEQIINVFYKPPKTGKIEHAVPKMRAKSGAQMMKNVEVPVKLGKLYGGYIGNVDMTMGINKKPSKKQVSAKSIKASKMPKFEIDIEPMNKKNWDKITDSSGWGYKTKAKVKKTKKGRK